MLQGKVAAVPGSRYQTKALEIKISFKLWRAQPLHGIILVASRCERENLVDTVRERERERERERKSKAKSIAEMKASLLCLPRSWPCNVSVKAQGEDGRKEELEQRKKRSQLSSSPLRVHIASNTQVGVQINLSRQPPCRVNLLS